MAKRKFILNEQDARALRPSYHQCRDGATCSRYKAVWMYGPGYYVTEILKLVGCSRSSLMNWCRAYSTRYPAGLEDEWLGGNSANLTVALRGQTPRVWSDPQRTQVCFDGTCNLLTGKVIVTRSESMNSMATAQHLEAVLAAYPQAPMLMLWDRAKWHGGDAVRAVLAANPRLEVMKHLVAAPDLNPQEQVWKSTRRAVGHNHRIAKFPTLADGIEEHLTTTEFPSSTPLHHGYHALRPMFE